MAPRFGFFWFKSPAACRDHVIRPRWKSASSPVATKPLKRSTAAVNPPLSTPIAFS